jgi:hypothetical protein
MSEYEIPAQSRTLPAWGFVAIIYIAITLLTFLPALWNSYAYDSAIILRLGKPHSPTYTPSDLWSPEAYLRETGVMSWRPASMLTHYLIDEKIFGLRPAISHFLNILVHAANGFLIWLIIRRINSDDNLADRLWIPPIFFLVSPLVSEVVYCTGFRQDSLATLMALGAVLVSLLGWRTRWRLAIFALCLLFGLAFKEGAYLAGLVAPLLIHLQRRDWRQTAAFALVAGAVGISFGLVWLQFRSPGYPRERLGGEGLLVGLLNFSAVIAEVYAAVLFRLEPSRIDHDFQAFSAVDDFRAFRGLLVIFGFILIVAAYLRFLPSSRIAAIVGTCWIILGFLPTSQIVPIPDPVAERFCYLPMVGLAILLSPLIANVSTTRLGAIAVAAFLLLQGLNTHLRGYEWRNDLTLNVANWESFRELTPAAARNLAGLYLLGGAAPVPGGLLDTRSPQDSGRARARLALDYLMKATPEDPELWWLEARYHAGEPNSPAYAFALRRAVETGLDRARLAWLAEKVPGEP